MSEPTTDLQQQLIEQLKALQAKPAAANPWQQAAPVNPTAAAGLAVPLKIDGVRVYLHFGAEAAASPDAIMATITALDNAGAPVDRWKPRQQWNGNSNRKW